VFAMEKGAVGLQKVSIAAGAVALTPGATTLSGVGFLREVFLKVKHFGKRAILLLG
jgi:hypothetical protein